MMIPAYTSRDWALDLHDHGFQVVLVPLKGKHPAVPWKQYQDQRIPREQVEEWFLQGEHNLAIITGVISGIVVVDGDSLQACEFIEETCTKTPMVVQTRKGRHYYYRHSGTKVPNACRVLDIPPVDLRGDGGLVIGPGSTHPSGHVYCLTSESNITPPPELPLYEESWFPDAVKAEPTSFVRPVLHFGGPAEKDAYELAVRYMNNVPGAITGTGGDNHTYVQACRLVRGFNLSDDQALDIMREWNARCQPAWSDQELAAKITHARAYGTGSFGSMLARSRSVGGLLIYGQA